MRNRKLNCNGLIMDFGIYMKNTDILKESAEKFCSVIPKIVQYNKLREGLKFTVGSGLERASTSW